MIEEEEEEEKKGDEDEKVDGAMSVARAAMAVGAMRAAGALEMKITTTLTHIQQFTSCTGGSFTNSLLH